MSSSNPTSGPKSPYSLSKHYTIQPHPYPSGGELRVIDDKGQLAFKITRRFPPSLVRYQLLPIEPTETNPLLVKPLLIGSTRIYHLLEEGVELFSLQQTSQRGFLLRDVHRRTIARFIQVAPDLAILRTLTTRVARIQFTRYPPPLHFRISCSVAEDRQWTLAALLYSIALTEVALATDSAGFDS